MPAAILTKLTPAGLFLALLALLSVWLAWRDRRWFDVESVAWIAGTWMLLVLIRSGTVYGGARHALFLWMMIAVAGGVACTRISNSERRAWQAAICLLWAAYVAAAWPVERPWSYHNFIAGGSEQAHLCISNEGLDLGQRNREVAEYYHRKLKPRGVRPFLLFWSSEEEWKYRKVDYTKLSKAPSANASGVFIVGPGELSPGPEQIYAPFLEMTPSDRIGVMQVFEGSVSLPRARARTLANHAAAKLYGTTPNVEDALKLLEEAVILAPGMAGIQIEMGNVRLLRGEREQALAAYRAAREGPAVDVTLRGLLDAHMRAVRAAPSVRSVERFRNPNLE